MLSQRSTFTNQGPRELEQEKASQSTRIVSDNFFQLTALLQEKFGDSLDAIILYGSCLHNNKLKVEEGVVDFYVVVDEYKHAFEKTGLRLLSAWLPPTVFYMEAEKAGLRAKYAVISMKDFEAGIHSWFHSYLWARFAQPARILYARDDACQQHIQSLLADAVMVFLRNTLPVLGNRTVDVEEIWINGLSLTYASELRAEQKNRARQLSHYSLADYIRLTMFAAPALADKLMPLKDNRYQCRFDKKEQERALRHWKLRRWQGRVLSILRLSKATFTFSNAIDYAAWKIKRHTGVSVEITPRLRRFPVLWGLKVLWSLLRRGVVR